MLNLIVFCSIFTLYVCGLNVKVECKSLVKKMWRQWSSRLACKWSNPWKTTWDAHTGSWKVFARLYFV